MSRPGLISLPVGLALIENNVPATVPYSGSLSPTVVSTPATKSNLSADLLYLNLIPSLKLSPTVKLPETRLSSFSKISGAPENTLELEISRADPL